MSKAYSHKIKKAFRDQMSFVKAVYKRLCNNVSCTWYMLLSKPEPKGTSDRTYVQVYEDVNLPARGLNVTSTLCYDFYQREIVGHIDFWAPSNFDLCEPLPGPVEEGKSQIYLSASMTYRCHCNICLFVFLLGKSITMLL